MCPLIARLNRPLAYACRLQSSLKLNFYFYTFLCFVGVIAFVFLLIAQELTLATLPSFIIALSNALGLVAITLFLGYGLVEVRCICCSTPRYPPSHLLPAY